MAKTAFNEIKEEGAIRDLGRAVVKEGEKEFAVGSYTKEGEILLPAKIKNAEDVTLYQSKGGINFREPINAISESKTFQPFAIKPLIAEKEFTVSGILVDGESIILSRRMVSYLLIELAGAKFKEPVLPAEWKLHRREKEFTFTYIAGKRIYEFKDDKGQRYIRFDLAQVSITREEMIEARNRK